MKIWVVLALSCSDCNSVGIATFDHEPTEAEEQKVAERIGGMYCIGTYTIETEVNGEPIEKEQHD